MCCHRHSSYERSDVLHLLADVRPNDHDDVYLDHIVNGFCAMLNLRDKPRVSDQVWKHQNSGPVTTMHDIDYNQHPHCVLM